MGAALDYAAGGEAGYTGGDAFGVMPGDVYDMAQMQPFSSAPSDSPGLSWWESAAQYGITRAIDNRFGPTNVGGNTAPGTYAGQNGRTYSNAPGSAGGAQAAGIGGGTLLLVAAGVLAFALLS